MLENHAREQYWWDTATTNHLADVAAQFEKPCCLCAPMLGRELQKRGIEHRVLDVDERLEGELNFVRFDLYRPKWLDEEFGAIFCDPPFWNVSLSQLFSAVRTLSHHNFERPLAICYPTRRATNLTATFGAFNLRSTGFLPRYVSVNTNGRTQIEFFANFEWPGASD